MSPQVNNDALPTEKITPLPSAMAAAAFSGIGWFLALEVTIRLAARFTRRSLYFYACLCCSWGIITHLVAITLIDWRIWDTYANIVVIHLSWCTYVISQSIVLYSRLNLVLKQQELSRYVLWMIMFNSVVFGLGTVVFGLVSVSALKSTCRFRSTNLISGILP
jgi:hypothetical protein